MSIKVSKLQVMQSAAGFYLGYGYWDEKELGNHDGQAYPYPYSRESGYFSNEDIAKKELNLVLGKGYKS